MVFMTTDPFLQGNYFVYTPDLSNQAMKGALRVAAAAVLCASGFDSAGALFFRNTEDAVGAQVRVVTSRSE